VANIASIIQDGRWQLPHELANFPKVVSGTSNICLPSSPLPDSLVWMHMSDGLLSAKQAFRHLRPLPPVVGWTPNIW